MVRNLEAAHLVFFCNDLISAGTIQAIWIVAPRTRDRSKRAVEWKDYAQRGIIELNTDHAFTACPSVQNSPPPAG
ncbi:hypothetical protein PISMIDRAFT_684571 [Pisolithus microcarpus 441]|uniref:Uncharacterized protein n=1 Tax=Pisolithus microcarpus 441 TaxID=765257 RepID=A0A0C9ZDK6_9AGAM|nr:hypothetical protein BKA83DRAFT_684571 [Pisolithus microcarpus]KIK18008.1 hypothetical protein PISMIDRAFT_684571 [Pisolithus microcarpus 441]